MAVREGNPQLATRAARAPVQRRAGLSNPVTESASLPALEGRTGSSQDAASDRLSDRTVVAPAVTDDRSGGVCPPLPRLVPLLPSLALRCLPADYHSRATEAHSPRGLPHAPARPHQPPQWAATQWQNAPHVYQPLTGLLPRDQPVGLGRCAGASAPGPSRLAKAAAAPAAVHPTRRPRPADGGRREPGQSPPTNG